MSTDQNIYFPINFDGTHINGIDFVSVCLYNYNKKEDMVCMCI